MNPLPNQIPIPENEKPSSIQELYEGHPERWTFCASARRLQYSSTGKHLRRCEPDHPAAVCWCLSGAIHYIYGKNDFKVISPICKKLDELVQEITYDHITSFVLYNDHKTFEEVLALVKKAKI